MKNTIDDTTYCDLILYRFILPLYTEFIYRWRLLEIHMMPIGKLKVCSRFSSGKILLSIISYLQHYWHYNPLIKFIFKVCYKKNNTPILIDIRFQGFY